MNILDTNLISEPLKPHPDAAVSAWLDAQLIEILYLTTISLTELRYGIAALPDGKRKQGLSAALNERVIALLAPRILPFTLAAADTYAAIRAHAKALGKAIRTADGHIAGIASAHGFRVATRDTVPVEAAGVAVINPWAI